ncbi:hypothetical protein CCR91_09610 [Thiorhodovibrio winogradskyi]|nr:hypothetical protein [Thiorhodovibrio winogradskyi]
MGDGVTQSALFIRKLLRRLGYRSHIHANLFPAELKHDIRPADALQSDPGDVLVFHHSMGHNHVSVIKRYTGPRILVYHNITPSHYFAPGTAERHYAAKGREQLADWKQLCQGAIAVSPYNARELTALGYPNVCTLPLLVDLEQLGQIPAARPAWAPDPSRPFLLSVGRLVENKRQHLLLEALWYLQQHLPAQQRPQFVLVGGTTSPAYADHLHAVRARLGLTEQVLIVGKCSQAHLNWLYLNAHVYVTASAHEGFCMPLTEAGFFKLPAIALASSNIPDTLGESGLLLDSSDPRVLAATLAEALTDTSLHAQLRQAAQNNLARFDPDALLPPLADYLAQHLAQTMTQSRDASEAPT